MNTKSELISSINILLHYYYNSCNVSFGNMLAFEGRLSDSEGRLSGSEGRLSDSEGRLSDSERRLLFPNSGVVGTFSYKSMANNICKRI